MDKNIFLDALINRHGKELQKKLLDTSVAVCGLGGLGSNAAILLARMGIGRLHLIDFDRVDVENLNRQQYAVSQIGQYKTDALKENISAISPIVKIECDILKITDKNFEALLCNDSIIIEAFDGAQDKAMLVNAVLEKFPKKYIVSGSGMSGRGSANTIKTRKIGNRLFLCGDGVSDVEADGTLYASRVAICAAHQAHAVLRIIAGETDV